MKNICDRFREKSIELVKEKGDYCFIFLFYFFPHLFMSFNRWDDVLYTTYFKAYNYNLFAFVYRQYQYWTSRVFIEAAVILFGWLPSIIWVIVDTLMIVLLYYSISEMIKLILRKHEIDRKYRLCQMMLFLSFPYALMATAGWLTTTINWTWMLALFSYSVKTLLCFVMGEGKKRNVIKNVFFCMAYIYATNFDVAAIVMLGLLIIIGLACIKSESYKFCIEYWEGTIITIANLILFIACPGNRVRMEQDAIIHDTADVLALSVGGKIRMGINSAFYHFVSIPNAVLFTVCIILLMATLLKNKKMSAKFIALVPAGVTVVWTGYIFFAYTLKNRTLTYIYPDASFEVCPKLEQYLAIGSALILTFSIIYLLRHILPENHLFIPVIVVFLVWGLFPSIALGFTSTISASILRVVSFLYLAFIFMNCIVIEYSGMLKRHFVWCLVLFLGGAGTAFNFIQMVRHIIVYG